MTLKNDNRPRSASLAPNRPSIEQPAAWPYAVVGLAYAARLHAEDGAAADAHRYERACEYLDRTVVPISGYEGLVRPPDAHIPTHEERELAKLNIWIAEFGSIV
jgi:hypothetical protein